MYDFTVILTVLYHVVKAPSDNHRNVLPPSSGYRKYYPDTYLEELKKIKKPHIESWSLKLRRECRTFSL